HPSVLRDTRCVTDPGVAEAKLAQIEFADQARARNSEEAQGFLSRRNHACPLGRFRLYQPLVWVGKINIARPAPDNFSTKFCLRKGRVLYKEAEWIVFACPFMPLLQLGKNVGWKRRIALKPACLLPIREALGLHLVHEFNNKRIVGAFSRCYGLQ